MIYVSTGGIRDKSASVVASEFYSHGIRGVELSGGLHSNFLFEDLNLLSKKISFRIHNYFPPPKDPFVFNLASLEHKVCERSLNHAISAIRLAATLGLQTYSFHAGYRVNPKVKELGNHFKKYTLFNRDEALEKFRQNVVYLAEEAAKSDIKLLIENNVLTTFNLNAYGDNPLLMVDPIEIKSFMLKMPENVKLLLDLGHLKVSGKTLDFDIRAAHEMLKNFIQGYHLSDNDGDSDSNSQFNADSWFWDSLRLDLDYYVLEIYNSSIDSIKEQFNLLADKLNIKGIDINAS